MKYEPFTPDPDTVATRILSDSQTAAADASGAVAESIDVPPTIAALAALPDDVFVPAAYRAILGRDPDPRGRENYARQLRSGAYDKVDVLGDLAFSAEGRHKGVAIPGLRWRYAIRRLGRLRGIGGVVRWLRAASRLPATMVMAQRNQSAIERSFAVAEDHAAAIQEIGAETGAIATRSRSAQEMVTLLRARVASLEAAREEIRTLREKLSVVEAAFEARHEHLATANARLVQQIRALTASAGQVSSVRVPAAQPQAPPDRSTVGPGLDDFYLEFEDRFRGSRAETKRRQEIYLRYVSAAGAGSQAAPIIDLGCGRGEWLELLVEHGCVARGIDLNRPMILDNRTRGLDVIEQDVISYLAAQPDESLGMVTGFHIIEHLPFETMVHLFDQCRRVLRPGGCVVFETPNPENLIVGAYTFYFDPTHRNPLPPQTTEFVIRHRGFQDVEILRLHPRSEAGSDDVLLNKWFRQATDYAVIAWKERASAAN